MKNPEDSKQSPFKHPTANQSPGFLLWKLTTLWQKKLELVFKALGITQTQYAILASILWLEQQNVVLTQATIVEHSKIDKMTLSKAVRKLEDAELVVRQNSSVDSRIILVSLSSKGRTLAHNAITRVEEADHEFFSYLDQQQQSSWKELTLHIIHHNNSETLA